MRAAALAFGSQGGLARRGWEIARMLERHGPKLSAVYRFRDLMLHYHGFTVMPPVLAETGRAFRLDRDGARAASARRVLRIVEPERIVSAVPQWRDFLMRDWPEAVPPAAILYPRDEAEARQWRRWLREGWRHGTALAADIFRGRPGAAQPGVRGPGAVAQGAHGGNGLGAGAGDGAHGRERPR